MADGDGLRADDEQPSPDTLELVLVDVGGGELALFFFLFFF